MAARIQGYEWQTHRNWEWDRGLAYSWVLGCHTERKLLNFRPHNISLVGLGTNLCAVLAVWNSMPAAVFSGIIWCFLDYHVECKLSMVGFCSGTITDLVAATPMSGYVPLWASVITGTIVVKFYLHIDDALDLGVEHAMGGIIGLLLNGLFADKNLVALDSISAVPSGWLNHHYR
ncbi:uncharacterized protein PHACADRAFT_202450 [Phanerochaete carnosa HHB-10118-sp]|uniref:Ammonium transporter AmtB-like domain-containing protein n=1 Tax=Phanerochaete carnosa (strain HHB-10118-sp) TaxID=650164 RepID=K5VCD3_PHACS|nr:uncharacterized protein PHACADRAFT_202450 [Phanerochaete carnosa HHB-10118-sp]EKM48748.1 hypothetical protein PHACADRAFT_202450 [Phanerochaete carnosa HHB-10118-sp]